MPSMYQMGGRGEPPNRRRTRRDPLRDGNQGKKGEPPNQKRRISRAEYLAALKKMESLAEAMENEPRRPAPGKKRRRPIKMRRLRG